MWYSDAITQTASQTGGHSHPHSYLLPELHYRSFLLLRCYWQRERLCIDVIRCPRGCDLVVEGCVIVVISRGIVIFVCDVTYASSGLLLSTRVDWLTRDTPTLMTLDWPRGHNKDKFGQHWPYSGTVGRLTKSRSTDKAPVFYVSSFVILLRRPQQLNSEWSQSVSSSPENKNLLLSLSNPYSYWRFWKCRPMCNVVCACLLLWRWNPHMRHRQLHKQSLKKKEKKYRCHCVLLHWLSIQNLHTLKLRNNPNIHYKNNSQ